MCGRFALSAMISEIAEEFSTKGQPESTLPIDWNIKPTQDIYIIRDSGHSNREIAIASWGMIAPWSKNSIDAQRSQSQAINARSESVHEKPTFRRAFRSHRCLIPATGYFEWATELGRLKSKQPVFISRDDERLIAFAGIFDEWISPEGKRFQSAAIITRDAVGEIAKVHNRMPVCMPEDRWDSWLNRESKDLENIRALMAVPKPDEHLRFWPVSTAVNSIRNNGSQLIEPVELGEPETLF